jgi:hypothetical protein
MVVTPQHSMTQQQTFQHPQHAAPPTVSVTQYDARGMGAAAVASNGHEPIWTSAPGMRWARQGMARHRWRVGYWPGAVCTRDTCSLCAVSCAHPGSLGARAHRSLVETTQTPHPPQVMRPYSMPGRFAAGPVCLFQCWNIRRNLVLAVWCGSLCIISTLQYASNPGPAGPLHTPPGYDPVLNRPHSSLATYAAQPVTSLPNHGEHYGSMSCATLGISSLWACVVLLTTRSARPSVSARMPIPSHPQAGDRLRTR